MFIVPAFSPEDARRAAFLNEPPVSFQNAPFYAAICAGLSQSAPPKFVVDRVTIDRKTATIVLSRPKTFSATRDIVPNWFFVPLGLLPAGEYSVEVRAEGQDMPLAVVNDRLRFATPEEEAKRNEQQQRETDLLARRFAAVKYDGQDYGAALYVRRQRLLERLSTTSESASDSTITTKATEESVLLADLAALGRAVDWSRDIYASQRMPRQTLAPAEPVRSAREFLNPAEPERGEWSIGTTSLADVWLCDGTDAPWYAAAHCRQIPAFDDALTAESPTEIQRLIRETWGCLVERFADPKSPTVHSVCAAGTPEDAIRMAHRSLHEGIKRPITLPADQPCWLALFTRRSFLPLAIWQREAFDRYSKTRSRQFLIEVSAYIRAADEPPGASAPVTFALIPLGKPGQAIVHVSAFPRCRSVCGRADALDSTEVVEAVPSEQLLQEISSRLPNGGGFRVAVPVKSEGGTTQ
ncbi:MAG: hypothetical protein KF688_12890 [Pirellulales bacterium]|nr:hypothetical protein [Pirellulales bacterium]